MRAAFALLLLAHSSSADVVCGGHTAATCEECPQGNGAAWCNGECAWVDGGCGGGCSGAAQSACGAGCDWIDATGLCRDALSDATRTASVHLSYYDVPVAQPAFWWHRIEVVDAASATYYASNGFHAGYGGVQQTDDAVDRALFSVWDTCDTDHEACDADDLASTVACGSGVTCEGFGGEGTGRKSQLEADLGAGPYYYVTQADDVGDGRARFSGYVWTAALGWRFLSRIELKADASLSGLYSFVEQWVAGENAARSALYGPSFMSDASDPATFHQIGEATFSYGTLENHRHVNAWSRDDAVGIATGGDTLQSATSGTDFPYPAADQPPQLRDFAAKVPCLQAATSTDAVEACLSDPAPTDSESRATAAAPAALAAAAAAALAALT